MNIAMLTPGFWPVQAGMELFFHNLAERLSIAGHKVHLFAPLPTQEFTEIESTYHLQRFASPADLFVKFAAIQRFSAFDVILVQSALHATSMALRLKDIFNIPIVLRPHGEDIQVIPKVGYGWRLDPKKNAAICKNIKNVDACVAISPPVQKIVAKIAPELHTVIIPNGVDTEFFKPNKLNTLKEVLNVKDNQKIVLMAGRNVAKKSFHLGLMAFSEALKSYREMILVHVGEHGNGLDLQKVASELGVARHFFQLGAINYFDMKNIYSSADIFLFPSKAETFGNVTIEAMACGLPCVEFDYLANREKIVNGQNGFIVPYGNTKLMSLHLLELLVNDTKRIDFSRQAVAFVNQSFSWPVVVSKYESLFAKVCL